VKKVLRLTGGSFAGKRIYVPGTGIGVRPATNLVREAVFSTLLSYLEGGVRGKKVLDLFAGTGSLGIEALSREAEKVTFVDSRREVVNTIIKNLKLLAFNEEVVESDVVRFLKGKRRALEYDLVFMDPPYRYTRCSEVTRCLRKALKDEQSAILVYERRFQKDLPHFEDEIHLLKRKKYGQTELLYYRL
jgi:16S rRNA (guanine(966)-N(2))-methyltransferase RsmD